MTACGVTCGAVMACRFRLAPYGLNAIVDAAFVGQFVNQSALAGVSVVTAIYYCRRTPASCKGSRQLSAAQKPK